MSSNNPSAFQAARVPQSPRNHRIPARVLPRQRRRWLPGKALAGIILLSLAGTSHSAPLINLTIMAYGVDSFDTTYMRTVIRPFEATHTNIKLSYYAVRDSRNALAVLRTQRLAPRVDIVILDPPNAKLAKGEQLLEEMDASHIPNAADLGPMGRELGFWALPAMYDSMTLVYAKGAFSQPPKSWRELWDPKHRGKVAMATNRAINGSMTAMTILAKRLASAPGGVESFDAGFDYLEKLAPNVLTWTPRPNQYWLVANRQAVMAVGWNSRSQSQMDHLGGYASTVPQEGTVAVPILIARVANRPNGEAAQAFINYALGPVAQKAFSEAMYYAPSNQKVKVSDAARARIPLLSPSITARLIPLDWVNITFEEFAHMREAWLTRIIKATP